MLVLECVLAMVVFSLALREPIRRWPWVFYLIALVEGLVSIFGAQLFGLAGPLWASFYTINRKGILAFGLITVVMYIGVLKKGSKLRNWLNPIRAQLSIIACILFLPHLWLYVGVYTDFLFNGLYRVADNLVVSYALAVIVTVLLVVLGITSIHALRRRMDPVRWKQIQRMAYPFFGLIYLHVFIARLRPAFSGAANVFVSAWPYLLVIGLYAVLRIIRWRLDVNDSRHAEAPVAVTAA